MTPQPISSAPKGELILLYCQRTAAVEDWWENSREPGWWELGKYDKGRGVWINDDYYPGDLTAQPTFWLSLPTPPWLSLSPPPPTQQLN